MRSIRLLAAHGDVAGFAQRRLEPRKQRLDRLRLGELLAEQPNRARVGHAVRKTEAQESHERKPVVDEKLGALVGQAVGGMDHQHLEHHHRIERRPPTLRAIRIGQRPRQFGPERLDRRPSRTSATDRRGRSGAATARRHRRTQADHASIRPPVRHAEGIRKRAPTRGF